MYKVFETASMPGGARHMPRQGVEPRPEEKRDDSNPYLIAVQKRLRAARKKSDKIGELEKKLSEGQELNPDQLATLRSKERAQESVEELTKLLSTLSTVAEQEASMVEKKSEVVIEEFQVVEESKKEDLPAKAQGSKKKASEKNLKAVEEVSEANIAAKTGEMGSLKPQENRETKKKEKKELKANNKSEEDSGNVAKDKAGRKDGPEDKSKKSKAKRDQKRDDADVEDKKTPVLPTKAKIDNKWAPPSSEVPVVEEKKEKKAKVAKPASEEAEPPKKKAAAKVAVAPPAEESKPADSDSKKRVKRDLDESAEECTVKGKPSADKTGSDILNVVLQLIQIGGLFDMDSDNGLQARAAFLSALPIAPRIGGRSDDVCEDARDNAEAKPSRGTGRRGRGKTSNNQDNGDIAAATLTACDLDAICHVARLVRSPDREANSLAGSIQVSQEHVKKLYVSSSDEVMVPVNPSGSLRPFTYAAVRIALDKVIATSIFRSGLENLLKEAARPPRRNGKNFEGNRKKEVSMEPKPAKKATESTTKKATESTKSEVQEDVLAVAEAPSNVEAEAAKAVDIPTVASSAADSIVHENKSVTKVDCSTEPTEAASEKNETSANTHDDAGAPTMNEMHQHQAQPYLLPMPVVPMHMPGIMGGPMPHVDFQPPVTAEMVGPSPPSPPPQLADPTQYSNPTDGKQAPEMPSMNGDQIPPWAQGRMNDFAGPFGPGYMGVGWQGMPVPNMPLMEGWQGHMGDMPMSGGAEMGMPFPQQQGDMKHGPNPAVFMNQTIPPQHRMFVQQHGQQQQAFLESTQVTHPQMNVDGGR